MDSGASSSMLFNREMLGIKESEKTYRVAWWGADLQVHEIELLKKVFDYLPLPKDSNCYDKNVVVKIMSLGRIVNEFGVMMDTIIDDTI